MRFFDKCARRSLMKSSDQAVADQCVPSRVNIRQDLVASPRLQSVASTDVYHTIFSMLGRIQPCWQLMRPTWLSMRFHRDVRLRGAMAKREASCAPRAAMFRKAPLDTLDNFEQQMQICFYHIQC